MDVTVVLHAEKRPESVVEMAADSDEALCLMRLAARSVEPVSSYSIGSTHYWSQ